MMRKPYVSVDRRKQGNTHGTIKPTLIVLHSTESKDYKGTKDVKGILQFLERTPDKLGIHFVVDRQGLVGQGATTNKKCYHAGDVNGYSVGIEMIGYARFNVAAWYRRRKQLKKVAMLLAWLSERLDIPLRQSTRLGVCRHRDISGPGGHWDPGYGFPMRRVLRMARKYRGSH